MAIAGVAAAAGVAVGYRQVSRIRSRPGTPLRSIDLGPVTTHRLTMPDGTILNVKEYGDPAGPPVVLLHGVLLQWWMWHAVGSHLLSDHRIVAWDMRGHGESTLGTAGMSLRAAAADLRVVMDHLSIRDAIVAGYSMGGMVLGRMLRDDPELLRRCSGLAFLSTSAAPAVIGAIDTGPVTRSRALAVVLGATDRRPLLDLATRPNALTQAVIAAVGFGRGATAAMVEDMRVLTSEMDPGVISASLHSMAAHDVRDLLGGIDRPTVVMVGDRDKLSPPVHSRVIASAIPSAELVTLEGAGHGIAMERPRDVADALRSLRGRI